MLQVKIEHYFYLGFLSHIHCLFPLKHPIGQSYILSYCLPYYPCPFCYLFYLYHEWMEA